MNAELLTGSTVGILGYKDLGRAVHKVLADSEIKFLSMILGFPMAYSKEIIRKPLAWKSYSGDQDSSSSQLP